jgi:transcriptional regulator NrdR family protein
MASSPFRALRCPHCYEPNPDPYPPRGSARCPHCLKRFTVLDEARDLFYQLWGDSQQSPLYRKRLWKRLQELVGW